MSSVPMARKADHKKLAMQRRCGVCRHFAGASLWVAGHCLEHGKETGGMSSGHACEQWTRRREGLDLLPWELLEGIKARPLEEANDKVNTACKVLRDNGWNESADMLAVEAKRLRIWTGPEGILFHLGKGEKP